MRHNGSSLHMWLLAAGIVVALLLGWGLGWVLALAVLGCGAMLAVVFWIGRSSAQQVATHVPDRDEARPRQ